MTIVTFAALLGSACAWIEFFQITGSTSFAVRCALEEIGVEYDAVDIAPYDREQPPDFASVNPWRSVPALRDGEAEVYETGACLLFLARRAPEAGRLDLGVEEDEALAGGVPDREVPTLPGDVVAADLEARAIGLGHDERLEPGPWRGGAPS